MMSQNRTSRSIKKQREEEELCRVGFETESLRKGLWTEKDGEETDMYNEYRAGMTVLKI